VTAREQGLSVEGDPEKKWRHEDKLEQVTKFVSKLWEIFIL